MADITPVTITLTMAELAFLSSRHESFSGPVVKNLGVPDRIDPDGDLAFHGAQSLVARELLDVEVDPWAVAPFVGLIGGAVTKPAWSVLASSGDGEAITSMRFLATQTALLGVTPGPLGSVAFMLLRRDADIIGLLVQMAVEVLNAPSGALVLAWEVVDEQPVADGLALARRGSSVQWRSVADSNEGAGVTTPEGVPVLVRSVLRNSPVGRSGDVG